MQTPHKKKALGFEPLTLSDCGALFSSSHNTHTRSIVYRYIISALCLFCVFFFFSVYTDIVMNHRGGLVMLVLYCESSIQEMWIDNKRECQASKYITSEFGLETVTV